MIDSMDGRKEQEDRHPPKEKEVVHQCTPAKPNLMPYSVHVQFPQGKESP